MQSDDDIPTDQSLIDTINKEFEEAASYRKKFEQDWREYEDFYDNKHWKLGEKKISLNECFKIIEYEVPMLTDERPGTDIVAIEEERTDDAKLLKEAIDHVYMDQKIDMKVVQLVRESLKTTNSYLYVDYEPDGDGGNGRIVIKNVHWRYVYLDPSCGDIDEAAYMHLKLPMKVEKLKRMFPDIADYIHPEEIESTDTDQIDYYALENRYRPPQRGISSQGFKPMDMAYLHERWARDYTMEPIPQDETIQKCEEDFEMLMSGAIPEVTKFEDHALLIQLLMEKAQGISMQFQQEAAMMGLPPEQSELMMGQEDMMTQQLIMDLIERHQMMLEQNPTGMRPKYKNFMRLTIKICNAIAYDGQPEVDDGFYPVAVCYGYKEAGKPYGFGEIKNILESQKALNELNWSEHQSLRFNANTGWLVDDNSEVDERSLNNRPNIIVKKKPGTEISRIPPGQASPQLQDKQEYYRAQIQNISGITESAQGQRPAGVTAAAAITALNEQATVRIRLKNRQLQGTMVRLGELVGSRIVKFWSSEKMLRNYDDSGRIQTSNFDPARVQDLKYMVRVSPGTTFGLSKEATYNIMKELLQMQVIDPQMFIKVTDLPYKGTLLTYMEERDQLAQQAEMLAQQNAELTAQLQQLTGQAPIQEAPQPGPEMGPQTDLESGLPLA